MREQIPLPLALAVVDGDSDETVADVRDALDDGEDREVCPHCHAATYCPRGQYYHLQECASLSGSPFDGDAGREVSTI